MQRFLQPWDTMGCTEELETPCSVKHLSCFIPNLQISEHFLIWIFLIKYHVFWRWLERKEISVFLLQCYHEAGDEGTRVYVSSMRDLGLIIWNINILAEYASRISCIHGPCIQTSVQAKLLDKQRLSVTQHALFSLDVQTLISYQRKSYLEQWKIVFHFHFSQLW